MNIKYFYYRAICAIFLILLTGCFPDPEPEDGTITIILSGADAHEGKNCFISLDDVNRNGGFFPIEWWETIASGTFSCLVENPDTSDTMVFSGGQVIAFTIMIDVDGSGSMVNSGDYVSNIITIEMDGDITYTLTYPTDFSL